MTQPTSVLVEPLTEECLPELVRLHRSLLDYSINSRLGDEHLAFLYRLMASDDGCYVRVAMTGDRPVGVVSGTLDADALKSRLLKTLPFHRALHIALAFAIHPVLARLWWEESRIAAPINSEGEKVKAVLTAILVDPSSQSRGVGRQLVNALEGYFVQHHVRAYRLDTLVTNTTARAFYQRLNFCEVAQRAGSMVLLRTLEQ